MGGFHTFPEVFYFEHHLFFFFFFFKQWLSLLYPVSFIHYQRQWSKDSWKSIVSTREETSALKISYAEGKPYVLVSFSCWELYDQKQQRRKGFIWFTFPYCCSSSREIWTGTWRQDWMQRPWKGAAYWLIPHGLFSLLSYRTQDHQPRNGPSHNGLGPLLSVTKKMPYS